LQQEEAVDQQLYAVWKERIAVAGQRYRDARAVANAMMSEAGDLPVPDGQSALARALWREREALREYTRLRVLFSRMVTGEIAPGETE
jgi:hypothetical protein